MHTTTLPTPVGPFSLAVAVDGVYAAGFTSDPGSLALPAEPVTGLSDVPAVTAEGVA